MRSDALDRTRRFCAVNGLLPRGAAVMACVSGGTDSMCLLDILCALAPELELTVCAAHFNHRLRGAESDGDEAFVRGECERRGVPLFLGGADVAAEAAGRGRGLEETARELRYAFFLQTARERGVDRVATAHNADDNLETILMRLVRGTGLRGLGGIPPARDRLVRPLLDLTRAEIEAYSRERGIPHREDSSNALDDYTRNLIRHRVVPALRSLNPSLNVTPAAGLLREDEELLTGLARTFLEGQEEDALDAAALAALPRPVAARAIRLFCGRELTRAHVEAVLGLAAGGDPSASVSLPGTTLRREYGKLLRGGPEPGVFPERRIALDTPVIIEEAGWTVTAEKTVFQGGIYNSLTTFPIKWDKIMGILTVRSRRPGDTLRLGGMTRSLKKLLIDKKIPRRLRDALPVIADGSGVLAAAGLGQDRDTLPQVGEAAVIIKIEERR